MLPVPEESFGGGSITISPTSKCSTYIIVVGALFVYYIAVAKIFWQVATTGQVVFKSSRKKMIDIHLDLSILF